MRKIIFLAIAVMMALCTLSSCENQKISLLKKEITAINDQCPINMGMIGDMIAAKYDTKHNDVQFYYVFSGTPEAYDAIKYNTDLAKSNIKLGLGSEGLIKATEAIADAGASLTLDYKSTQSGKSVKIAITNDELKDIVNNPMTDKDRIKVMVDNQVAMENGLCPYAIEAGVTLVEVVDEGAFIVYKYKMDENLYDINALEYQLPELKQNTATSFRDPTLNQQLQNYVAVGKGLVYRYYGDHTGHAFDVVYTTDELKSHKNR